MLWSDSVNFVLKFRNLYQVITHTNKAISLAYMSLVRPNFEYGATCWDPYTEGQINALDRVQEGQINASDRVQKIAAKFANLTNDSVGDTSVLRRKTARICALFEAYTREGAWKSIGERLKGSCYLSRDDHNRKIRARKQRTDIGKYSFVNRTIKLRNQLPAKAPRLFPVNHTFLERGLGK